jgi:hypothetical protein
MKAHCVDFNTAKQQIADTAGYISHKIKKAVSEGKPLPSTLDTFRLDADSSIYKATAKHRSDILFEDYQIAGAKLFRHGIEGEFFYHERRFIMTEEIEKNVEQKSTDERIAGLLDQLSALTAENASIKAEITNRKILDELTTIAKNLKIPESVVTHDLKHYIPDFIIKDGSVVLRFDETRDVTTVLKTLQDERQHWQPVSRGGSSGDSMKATNNANNFAATVERQSREWFDLN